MKIATLSLLVFSIGALVRADELRVSSKEPIIVTAPDHWKSAIEKPPISVPFETYRVDPPGDRNAACLISVFDKNKQEFTDPAFLKKILRSDSRPYVNSPEALAKLDIKELKIKGGLGFYANFVDPDLVGKPVQKGSYKIATPIILSLGSQYLIKVTIMCDEINGADYREFIKVIESIAVKKE